MKRVGDSIKIVALAALVGASVSCGDVARQGRSPVYLVLDSLTGVAGGKTGQNAALLSDVITLVRSPAPCTADNPCPTIYNDTGQAAFHVALKDITSPTGPTSNNAVTIERFHVAYRRADGRNVQGVDVPYAFDGAVTVTIPGGGSGSAGFELVRHVAKQESPLVQLADSPTIITTIADVTFYGHDQVGNDISVAGTIQVDFGNFADQ